MLTERIELLGYQLLAACAYLMIGRWLMASPRTRQWNVAFALLNLAAVYALILWGRDGDFTLRFNLVFAGYVALVSAQYAALRFWKGRPGDLPWAAFLMPLGVLVSVRYVPFAGITRLFSARAYEALLLHPEFTRGLVLTGISYMAFRTSYLALEVGNGVVARPGYWEYLGFAFFAPTMSVGPINRYSEHRRAFEKTLEPAVPAGEALLRVLIGAVKFRFLGPLINQLTYSGLLLDGHPHPWFDLPVAAVAYYLYLYCNFSGFCDIAIGAAGLMGIAVSENFADPFTARNLADFWNRWHITLSQYMRDVVFSPVSRTLVRAVGPRRANHAIALTIILVFLLVGVWHGTGWHYAAFGAAHGLGVAANHYYTVALKKRLGKEGLATYMRSPLIHAAAVSMTFVYVAASMFLFANDGPAMKAIFSAFGRQ